MNLVLGPIRDLVDRRLWPVALLLLAAVFAAPLLLADREEVPPASAAAAPLTDEGMGAAAIVSIAGPDGVQRRRVLGARKDPFTPTGRQPKPAKSVSTAPAGSPGTTVGAPTSFGTGGTLDGGSSVGGGSPVGGGGTGGAPSPIAPSPIAGPPTPVIVPGPATGTPDSGGGKPEIFSLRLRFDDAARTLKRLDPLPSAENPSIIYLGVLEDGKTAVFLLDADVTAQGDGKCRPTPSDCQRLYLREGETEFFDIGGENGSQHQIDLIDIRAKKVRSGSKAAASASAAGRRALRSRTDRVGRLRFDDATGRLRYLSMEGWRRQVERGR